MDKINVADISRWQGTIDWNEFVKHIDAVVIKAGGADGGVLYTDGMLARNQNEVRRLQKPHWYYWYKGAGISARDQATYFLKAVGGLQAGEGVMLDDENEAKVNPDFVAEFTDAIKELTGGVINTVYSNLSRWQGVELAPVRDRNVGAVVAKYGANGGTVESAGQAPGGIDIPIIMWQYTSAARIGGVTANTVDMNLFYGTVDQFLAYGAKDNVPAPSAPAPVSPVAAGNGEYIVVKGDTLSGIGQKLGMDWRVIASTNGIVAPYTIFPDQKLKVYGGTPGQAEVAPAGGSDYRVVPGDTLIGIGIKTGHSWKDIANLNGIADPYTIYPGQVLKLDGGVTQAAQSVPTYTVVSGDGLIVIGQKTGVDWKKIATLNNIAPPYTIYPNQVLKLS